MALCESKVTGQHHFLVVGEEFKIAPDLRPPVPSQFPGFSDSMLKLNEQTQFLVGPMYDKIVKLWFNSKLAPPPENLKLIHQNFFRSELGIPSPRLKEVDLDEKIVSFVVENQRVSPNKAVQVIKEVLSDISELSYDINDWQFKESHGPEDDWDDTDGVWESHSLLFFDQNLEERFVKQLALAGIFTRTQFNLLSREQKERIKTIKVSKKLTLSCRFDFFVEQVEEIQFALPRREEHDQ